MQINKNAGPVIILEQDPDDQQMIKDALEHLQVKNKIIIFDNGESALNYLYSGAEKPFLIISGINLPRYNGFELRSKIQSDQKLLSKSIPFLFLSTDNRTSTVERAYNATVQGYFEKPRDVKELERMLKIILDYWAICKYPESR
jgi:CheY-like chemotaxis protein